MNKHNFDADLRQQIQALPKDRAPERDLWSGIEVALASNSNLDESAHLTKTAKRMPLYAVAASIAFVGVLSWSMLQPHDGVGVDQEDLVALLADQHQAQKQALLVKFEGQPALTENWQKQLEELDEAALAIKAALKQDSDNIPLLKMLQKVHQQQIDLIERVHAPKWRQI